MIYVLYIQKNEKYNTLSARNQSDVFSISLNKKQVMNVKIRPRDVENLISSRN